MAFGGEVEVLGVVIHTRLAELPISRNLVGSHSPLHDLPPLSLYSVRPALEPEPTLIISVPGSPFSQFSLRILNSDC